MNTAQRAANLGRKIDRRIKNGTFRLDEGYLNKQLKGGRELEGKCEGCALAAAAFAMSRGKVQEARSQTECVTTVMSDSTISREEAAQLEMGYEGWVHVGYTIDLKPGGELRRQVFKEDRQNPFHKLGVKLRLRRLRTRS